jgi:hypothetical protein
MWASDHAPARSGRRRNITRFARAGAGSLGLAFALAVLPGCAVVTVAGAAAGAVISVTGAVISTGVKVTGKVIEKVIDAVTPDAKPDT